MHDYRLQLRSAILQMLHILFYACMNRNPAHASLLLLDAHPTQVALCIEQFPCLLLSLLEEVELTETAAENDAR